MAKKHLPQSLIAEVAFWAGQGLDEAAIAKQVEHDVETVRRCLKAARKPDQSNTLAHQAHALSEAVIREAKRRLDDDKMRKRMTVQDLERLANIATRAYVAAVTARPKERVAAGPGRISLVTGTTPPPPPTGGDEGRDAGPEPKPLKIVSVA